MGFDWIDSALEKGEHLPLVGGSIGHLRQLYQLIRIPAVDRGPFHTMAQTMNDLKTKHKSVTADFIASVQGLQTTWKGEAATKYLGTGLLEDTAGVTEIGGLPTAQQMQVLMAEIDEVLSYNAGANLAIADTLETIATTQAALESAAETVAIAAGVDVGATVLDEIGVGEVIQGIDSVVLVKEVDTAIEVGEELETVVKAADVGEAVGVASTAVEAGEGMAQAAKFAQFSMATIRTIVAIGGTIALLGSLLVPVVNQPWTPPGGTQDSPQNISEEEQKKRQALLNEHPDPADQAIINHLFALGFTADEIRAMLASGMSLGQILNLVRTIGESKVLALIQDFPDDYADIIISLNTLLEHLQTRPNFATDIRYLRGFNQMVDDILMGDYKAVGALYVLGWCIDPNHLSQIDYLEDVDADGNEAVDVVLINGNVVELKSWSFFKFNDAGFNKYLQKLIIQMQRDLELYPNGKTIYVDFDTTKLPPPPYSKQVLDHIEEAKRVLEGQTKPGSTSRVKVVFWPPQPGLPTFP
jgi:hypothetical protein